MPTFEKCNGAVLDLAENLIREYETHHPLGAAGVRIDYLFAYPNYDENDKPIGFALKERGRQILGKTRIINLSDRAKGHGDAEIKLDGEFWDDAPEAERKALLDHELHHISVMMTASGTVKKDDCDRPRLRLRKHDVEVGWFNLIAQRHGVHSVERQQANAIMEHAGQFYWPELVSAHEGRMSKLETRVSK